MILNEKFYQDSTLIIFEVKERFPTGFFMQQAKIEKDVRKINGARKFQQKIFEDYKIIKKPTINL